ncbi:glycosyltransferase family 4 protein [Candidatus Peregrinibacteria bacterium]|nr:glycosyltransferase family 4 protein [bacterium]NCQ56102.1 glycosyltransferase family 4 protein [Candidatus Parcubacteria bacterium]NCS67926.1 glycosyltransferase family 4 protein [Candidatus Peregrinibacteria bacterium]
MMSVKNKKVVIVADWLTNQGGAEQVVTALADAFPQAPIYTSVYNPGSIPALVGRDIRGSWLQKLPAFLRRKHQFLLPFFPGAFARLNLSEFDIIISSSSAFSKNVRKTRVDQIHFCYCHTPTRYLYNARQEYIETYPLPAWLKPFKALLPKLLDYLTVKDLKGAKGVDYFISNSNFIAARIQKYYGREAKTIYPCTNTKIFSPQPERGDYFLAVGRFIPYKRFDLLVKTFAKNGLPLKLGGVGPEFERCKAMAQEFQAKNIEFMGFVPYSDLPGLYAGARAFLFPAEEDFGLTPVEAMASGVPVIAFGKGGATESVNSKTGLFFEAQNPRSLQESIDKFIRIEQKFSSEEIADYAEKFSVEHFQQQIIEFVVSKIK